MAKRRAELPIKWLAVAGVALLVTVYFVFDLGQFLSLEYLKSRHDVLLEYRGEQPIGSALIYFVLYVVVTGLSLPGAAVLTVIGGSVFGLFWGTILVSFASTAGATVAFLAARYLFRDWVQSRFDGSLARVNEGIARDGGFYLFALRLVPAFPFFIINLAMGLTSLGVGIFVLVSQLGMLAGTVVFVNAGTQLAKIDSLAGILSPGLVLSFCLLAVFPFIARAVVERVRRRRVYRDYPRPARFERDLVVIGGGSAGLVSALIGTSVRAKVTLVERERMGGDCLNTGCVPSKALIRSARFLSELRRSSDFGIREASAKFEFAEVMDRVQRVIATIEPNDSIERFESLGVECVSGNAQIVSPFEVQIDARTITTRNIIIAAGAEPLVPPIRGLESVRFVTSDNVWGLREVPGRLLVLGGGPIGCELAQCFVRFGSDVSLVEMLPRVLAAEDPEVSELLGRKLSRDGITMLTGYRAEEFGVGENGFYSRCVSVDGQVDGGGGNGEDEKIVEFDLALIAVGRRANVDGYGAKELGLEIRRDGSLETNGFLQTKFPNVLACGDVTTHLQFTHVASHEAWYATVNALFGNWKKFRVDYSAVPRATYTDPEVASVGMNEQQAKAEGIAYEVTRMPLDEVDRAIADGHTVGEVKVLTVPNKDRILGATIVGAHASDLISELVLGMRHRIGLNKILGTVHAYPTYMEANKLAAGRWRRDHAPQKILHWLERYHRWRRG